MNKLLFHIILAAGIIYHPPVTAQSIEIKHHKKSTSYVKDYYKTHLIIRAYESTKFNNFKFTYHGNKAVYKPNEHNNLGLGFTYKFLSINLGFHLPFTDRDRGIYGTTRQLDLQTHIYSPKFIIDFYGQFYKGFYLAGDHPLITGNIKRPDMRSRDISLSVLHVFNYNRFSYNAAPYQNEVQKKSAGSFIAGAGIFHTYVKADSAILPAYMRSAGGDVFSTTGNIAIGAEGGYGYTLVILKRFFITGILTGGPGIAYSVIPGSLGTQLQLNIRGAAGYNYNKYFAGISYVHLQTITAATTVGSTMETNKGNFRIIVARRLPYHTTIVDNTGLLKAD